MKKLFVFTLIFSLVIVQKSSSTYSTNYRFHYDISLSSDESREAGIIVGGILLSSAILAGIIIGVNRYRQKKIKTAENLKNTSRLADILARDVTIRSGQIKSLMDNLIGNADIYGNAKEFKKMLATIGITDSADINKLQQVVDAVKEAYEENKFETAVDFKKFVLEQVSELSGESYAKVEKELHSFVDEIYREISAKDIYTYKTIEDAESEGFIKEKENVYYTEDADGIKTYYDLQRIPAERGEKGIQLIKRDSDSSQSRDVGQTSDSVKRQEDAQRQAEAGAIKQALTPEEEKEIEQKMHIGLIEQAEGVSESARSELQNLVLSAEKKGLKPVITHEGQVELRNNDPIITDDNDPVFADKDGNRYYAKKEGEDFTFKPVPEYRPLFS